MRFLDPIFRGVSIEMPPLLGARSLASRSLILGLPILSAAFIIIFLITSKNISEIIDRAIIRSAQFKASAISASIEHLLRETRNQLLMLASGSLDSREMLKAMKLRAQGGAMPFREVAFIGREPDNRYVMLAHDGEIVNVPAHVAWEAPGGPFNSGAMSRERGHVGISRPTEVSYPLVPVRDTLQSVEMRILRFSTPVYEESGEFKGILSLALDLSTIRDKISSIFPPEAEEGDAQGRSFFFDRDGWMMFQAENLPYHDKPLSSDIVRAGFHGNFGRPGFSQAFRPAAEHLNYWTMVADIQARRSGVLPFNSRRQQFSGDGEGGSASYAPVTFESLDGATPQVIGGIALLDDNLPGVSAWRVLTDIFLRAFVACVLLSAIFLFCFARITGKRINMITSRIEEANNADSVDQLAFSPVSREFDKLCRGINGLLTRMSLAREVEQTNAAEMSLRKKRQPVPDLPATAAVHASDLVGESPQMQSLYRQIEKAAQVSADVLVIGETGTGKELVSLSIHKLSDRRDGPFISINCGALDETLLMDTLFGHVKGAFTEARADRKGAFLAATGGTLLLDEIGNAPLKVQQALLRALSTRQIRPLGSDEDINFDVRVIAATNSPIGDDRQDFRNDLYYRLAVITIETPPLRTHKEDIYLLLAHFLEMKSRECGFTEAPALSYGALEKLLTHDWPGNVREFRNMITRALAFCDGKMIMAEDLNLASEDRAAETANNIDRPRNASVFPEAILQCLNKRQKDLWPAVASLPSFTRQDYQKLAGENISQRTAQYDLQVMMRLGLLSRSGKGPQQRYSPKYFAPEGNAVSAEL